MNLRANFITPPDVPANLPLVARLRAALEHELRSLSIDDLYLLKREVCQYPALVHGLKFVEYEAGVWATHIAREMARRGYDHNALSATEGRLQA